MSVFFQIRLIIVLVSLACSLIGIFLVLRQRAMMVDSITHTVLLGIVLSFFAVQDLNSPILIFGAAVTGVFTVWLTESLQNTRLVSEDAAIGLVFPLLFSIAIMLISKYTANIHLDIDSVLLGKVEYAPFDFLTLGEKNIGAKAIYTVGFILLINAISIFSFFKLIKLSSFDPAMAVSLGFSATLLNYGLMTLASLTTVASFQAVGSILVIAFMVGPAATAYLLTENLNKMIAYSMIIGVIDSLIGVEIAFLFDLSIAGTVAAVIGAVFLLVFVLEPVNGLLGQKLRHIKNKREFRELNILFHIMHHSLEDGAEEEHNLDTMNNHLELQPSIYEKSINSLLSKKHVYIDEEKTILLTVKGLRYVRERSDKIFNLKKAKG